MRMRLDMRNSAKLSELSSMTLFMVVVCFFAPGLVSAEQYRDRTPPSQNSLLARPSPVHPLDSSSSLNKRPSKQFASHHVPAAWEGGLDSVEYDDSAGPLTYEPFVPGVAADSAWYLQVMPQGLMYRSYLAGAKEPRFASYWNNDKEQGDIWDAALGGRLGLLRYGTCDNVFPEGIQVDLEGGSQARLDPNSNSNELYSVDFRVGIPVCFAFGPWQFKTGYYHISSHLGDEFLINNPGARRLNYTRDAILLGVGYFYTEKLRLYAETAYAASATDGAEPWEFQMGADWAPARDTGIRGAPFAAVNGHLREEVDFGGNLVLQAGWAWRQNPRGSLFRVGVQYYRGKSDQFEYYDRSEERFGWGLWADF
jgi:hypothetical protein